MLSAGFEMFLLHKMLYFMSLCHEATFRFSHTTRIAQWMCWGTKAEGTPGTDPSPQEKRKHHPSTQHQPQIQASFIPSIHSDPRLCQGPQNIPNPPMKSQIWLHPASSLVQQTGLSNRRVYRLTFARSGQTNAGMPPDGESHERPWSDACT